MKKYKITIILAAMALSLTACADKPYSYDEASAPKAMDNFNEADIIGRMTAIKNGLKPNLKPSGQTPAPGAAGSFLGRPDLHARNKRGPRQKRLSSRLPGGFEIRG